MNKVFLLRCLKICFYKYMIRWYKTIKILLCEIQPMFVITVTNISVNRFICQLGFASKKVSMSCFDSITHLEMPSTEKHGCNMGRLWSNGENPYLTLDSKKLLFCLYPGFSASEYVGESEEKQSTGKKNFFSIFYRFLSKTTGF